MNIVEHQPTLYYEGVALGNKKEVTKRKGVPSHTPGDIIDEVVRRTLRPFKDVF